MATNEGSSLAIAMVDTRLFIIGLKFVAASFSVGWVLSWFELTPQILIDFVGTSPLEVVLALWDAAIWSLPHVLFGAVIVGPLWGLAYLVRPPEP